MKQNVTSKYSEMVTKAKSGVSDMMNHSITSFITLKDTVATNTTSMKNTIVSNSNTSKNTFIQNLTSMKQENDKQTSSIYQTTSKWSDDLKRLVSGTKATATFTATTTPVKTISDAINNLKSKWTGKSVDFKVNPNATSVYDVMNANAERHAQWYDKTANLWMNPNVTSKQAIDDAYNSLTSGWSDKTANLSIGMSIDSVSGSIQDIKQAAADKFNSGVTELEKVLRNKKVITHNEQLPRINAYATGGIIDKATIAMIGEAGTEAVVPLENNTGWLGKMADMLATEMSYNAPAYTSGSYTANTSGARSEQDIAEQNALLREQNRLLQIIANKDVTISSSDVFNATMDEGENYYHKTGNSPFIF